MELKIWKLYNMNIPEPQTKCSELWFEHAWEDTTNYTTLQMWPPIRNETCKNCWLKRYHRENVERWIEYI